MHLAKLAALLLVLFALIFSVTPTQAETVNCIPITTLPAVITVQGVYCFTGHLNTAITSGNAIDIQTNNVVLDLNGFKLGGLAAGTGTQVFGIHAFNRQNITIKNGTVRGFFGGIVLEDAGASQGHVVEGIRADQNPYVGIEVHGAGTIVRNNQVVATGGTTVFGLNGNAYGIVVAGTGPRVLSNDVIDTVATGDGIAQSIFVSSANSAVVEGNRLGSPGQGLGFGIPVAVQISSSLNILVVNNRITRIFSGIHYDGGSSGKFRDNLTSGVTFPFPDVTSVVVDAGNNN